MILGLYLFLLVGQLGKHFWPDWSFVSGIRVDYLSPTLYLTDMVWIVIVINNFQFLIFNFQTIKNFLNKKYLFVLLFLVNILIANRWQSALYGWLRIWQFWWVVKYISQNVEKTKLALKWVIPSWIALESMLSVAQVVLGGSVGGLYYFLGERRFDYLSLGVARISWFGSQYIRAYGTFSHPNSLAGFLLVSLVLWNRNAYMRSVLIKNKLWRWLVNWMGVVGLILTGSRVVWATGLLIIFLKTKIKWGWKLIFMGIMMMVLAILLNNIEVVGGWSVSSMDLRTQLLKSSFNMFKDNWLFGVGVSNFLVNLPEFMKGYWWLQPVHNIFMLGLTEMGVVGFGMVMIFLLKNIDFKKYGWVWMAIILTGMFDHYWLTLPQNIGLLAVVMGVSKKNKL